MVTEQGIKAMNSNFFANQDSNLPKLNDLKLPKIKRGLPSLQKKGLPNLQITQDSDLLFEIDGKNILMSDIAEKVSQIYFQS